MAARQAARVWYHRPGRAPGISRKIQFENQLRRRGVEKVAAYRDEAGGLHAVSAVCTHLGCVVQWNGAEKSWDCPCHASRFDVDGRVLQGPAVKDLGRRRLGD